MTPTVPRARQSGEKRGLILSGAINQIPPDILGKTPSHLNIECGCVVDAMKQDTGVAEAGLGARTRFKRPGVDVEGSALAQYLAGFFAGHPDHNIVVADIGDCGMP